MFSKSLFKIIFLFTAFIAPSAFAVVIKNDLNVPDTIPGYDAERAMAVHNITATQDAIKSGITSLNYVAKTSSDFCSKGQHNLKIDDDYSLWCIHRITYVYGVKSTVDAAYLAQLEQQIHNLGWNKIPHEGIKTISQGKVGTMEGFVNIMSGKFGIYQGTDMAQTLDGMVTGPISINVMESPNVQNDIKMIGFDAISTGRFSIDGIISEHIEMDRPHFKSIYSDIAEDNPYLLTISINQTYAYHKHLHIPLISNVIGAFSQ